MRRFNCCSIPRFIVKFLSTGVVQDRRLKEETRRGTTTAADARDGERRSIACPGASTLLDRNQSPPTGAKEHAACVLLLLVLLLLVCWL